MPTQLIDTDLAPHEQDEQLRDLEPRDRQRLREQFDEIIAAEWPQQPPDPPQARAAVAPMPAQSDPPPSRTTVVQVPGQSDARGGNTTAGVLLPDHSHTPQIDAFAWQRSPPADLKAP